MLLKCSTLRKGRGTPKLAIVTARTRDSVDSTAPRDFAVRPSRSGVRPVGDGPVGQAILLSKKRRLVGHWIDDT